MNNLNEVKIIKKLDEIIKLQTAIRNLLILDLAAQKPPHVNIAKAAGIQKSKIYTIVPKLKKSKNRKTSANDT